MKPSERELEEQKKNKYIFVYFTLPLGSIDQDENNPFNSRLEQAEHWQMKLLCTYGQTPRHNVEGEIFFFRRNRMVQMI